MRYAYADDLSTAIINNMVVTDVDPQRLSDISGLSDAMRQYMHKLNLTADIMAEVKSKYGEKEARTIRLIWGSAKDVSVKISVDDAASELQSRGYTFQSDNVADQFLEMLDVIEESRNLASRELSKTAKQLLSSEEYDSLQEEIRDDILSFMMILRKQIKTFSKSHASSLIQPERQWRKPMFNIADTRSSTQMKRAITSR